MANAIVENRTLEPLADVAVTAPIDTPNESVGAVSNDNRLETARSPSAIVTPSFESQSQSSGLTQSEIVGLSVILAALLVHMGVHIVLGRLAGGRVELRRLPERRFEFRMDVNSANAIELQLLPGIGPQLANRIVDDRNRNGPFESIEDLRRVKGIGPKTLEEIRCYLVESKASER